MLLNRYVKKRVVTSKKIILHPCIQLHYQINSIANIYIIWGIRHYEWPTIVNVYIQVPESIENYIFQA